MMGSFGISVGVHRFRGARYSAELHRILLLPLWVMLVWGNEPAAARTAPPCAACAVVVMDPGLREHLPRALNGLEVLVRHRPGDDAAAAVDVILARGGRAGYLIEGLPPLERVAEVPPGVETLLIRLDAGPADPVALAFDLKTRVTALRAARPEPVRIGLAAPHGVLRDLLARDVAPYLDFAVSPSGDGLEIPWWRDAGDIVNVDTVLGSARANASRSVWEAPRDPAAFRRALSDLAAAARFLPAGLIPGTVAIDCVPSAAAGARTPSEAGAGRERAGAETLWLDPATLDHVTWIAGCTADALRFRPAGAPRDIVPLTTGTLLVRVPEPSAGHFAQGVDVRAPRTLSAAEIVARHQTVAARQAAAVRTRISTGTLTLAFEAPGFAAPVTIASDVVLYSDRRRTDLEQRAIEVNGVAFTGRGVPKLPIVEPERVAAVPLAIELTDAYEYTLDGTDTVQGTRCYVVAFVPVPGERTAFRGRAWIAADTFALVKVAATQVRLRGPIVSSEQVDTFVRVEPGLWLPGESRVNQVYEGAAHRTPIERVLTLRTHEINAPDFTARRAAAYASDHVMLRDTPEGFRYLRRRPLEGEGQEGARAEPVVEEAAERVRTVVFGTIVDPNITRPLPFAGISYVDFNLFGTGMQFNGFFGGTFGQLAFSAPSLGGSAWQLAGRALAVASAFNDRAFDGGLEQYDRNIRQRPASMSLWLRRSIGPRLSLRAGYDLQYTDYTRADTTNPAFTVPPAQVIHALRLAVEAQRAGWQGTLWWSPAVRQQWRRWGMPDSRAYDPDHRDFQRVGASLTRSMVISRALVVRAEGAWMSGRDLDRFSRYAFGAFENPLRGYPGALIRYDRGAVARGALAWSAAGRLRLDAFADSALVHDPGFGDRLQRFTGVGMAVEVPAPFGTLLSAEWGYGLQGRRANGGQGTHVLRLTAYRLF